MEKETIKENIEKISGIESMLKEVKALFTTEKKDAPEKVEPVKEEAKVEFNHEEFTKNFNDFKTSIEAQSKSYDEKLVAFEAQIKTANDTIVKQSEQLKSMFELLTKVAETPVAASKQAKKEEVKKSEPIKVGLEVWNTK